MVGLVVGYLSRLIQPRSKLLVWSPHNFVFRLRSPAITLQTNSLTVQNVGRKEAEDLEIIHESRPDFFEFFPAVPFEEYINPTGEHVIKVRSLASREWLSLQLLSYTKVPVYKNVRWRGGQARWVQIQPQRVWPRWRVVVWNVIFIIGAGTLTYLGIIAAVTAYHHLISTGS